MRRAGELMDAGYAAALESVPEILALLETRSVKSAVL
jgi:hypothetical protein